MNTSANPNHARPDAIVHEVVIRASAERVFSALTDPAQRAQWWGAPGKFEVRHMTSELRPGGAWAMHGVAQGDKPFVLSGIYRAVERPAVLEFTWHRDGDPSAPPTLVRFDLTERGGETTVKLTHSGFAAQAHRDAYKGWPWLLALLQNFVQSAAG